jgi:hypothetical protein
VEPALRELFVGLDLLRVERHRLFVRQRQHEPPAASILQLEDLGNRDAAADLPELGRCQDRTQHLLVADRVHLLADDLHNLLVHPPAEGKERPEPRADLADEPTANEELVTRSLGVGRRVAQGRKEKL